MDLKKFNLTQLRPNRLLLLLGRRGTGKTTLMEHMLDYIKDKVDYCLMMSPTMDTRREWKKVVPGFMIHDTVDKDRICDLLEHQEKLGEKEGKRRTVAIVWDDCMYLKNALKGDAIRNLFFNGRHLDVWFINSAQYLMDLEPALRLQVDYIFSFKDPVPDNRAKLRKYYCGHVPATLFEQCMKVATDDYKCLVMDQVEGKLYWYKAPEATPPFKMCTQNNWVYWRINDLYQKKNPNTSSHSDVNLYEGS